MSWEWPGRQMCFVKAEEGMAALVGGSITVQEALGGLGTLRGLSVMEGTLGLLPYCWQKLMLLVTGSWGRESEGWTRASEALASSSVLGESKGKMSSLQPVQTSKRLAQLAISIKLWPHYYATPGLACLWGQAKKKKKKITFLSASPAWRAPKGGDRGHSQFPQQQHIGPEKVLESLQALQGEVWESGLYLRGSSVRAG